MQTFKRLMKVYNNTPPEYFDETSKYVFMSDCHRGNGDYADEFAKNRNTYVHALDYYYNNGFTYVEVGDGDELGENSRFKIIHLAHTDAINAMKRFHDHGRMIMLYGNHNILLRNDQYVKNHYYRFYNEFTEEYNDLFNRLDPREALLLRHRRTELEIFVVHGHQGDLPNDTLWRLSAFSLRYIWRHLHSFGFKNPASPVNNVFKSHKLEKNYNKWVTKNQKLLICGHTHRFKFPRKDDPPYFNSGCCIYPASISALEIENDEISLVRWKVFAREGGILKIEREVLKGPVPLAHFDPRVEKPTAVIPRE